ncbi:MAG TPA: hypothetical protein VFS10_16000 [Pyrinomonadaceae bacterium]|nr:hypothetical protein [Pyrinomonadaceae bacterium]
MAENENAVAAGATDAGATTAAEPATPQAETAAPPAAQGEGQTAAQTEAPPAAEAPPEEISYHAVEKDGQVTALWEMQGRKHLRTIDPRSRLGQEILRHYTADHPEETA